MMPTLCFGEMKKWKAKRGPFTKKMVAMERYRSWENKNNKYTLGKTFDTY